MSSIERFHFDMKIIIIVKRIRWIDRVCGRGHSIVPRENEERVAFGDKLAVETIHVDAHLIAMTRRALGIILGIEIHAYAIAHDPACVGIRPIAGKIKRIVINDAGKRDNGVIGKDQ
jgi:hypothetical protein